MTGPSARLRSRRWFARNRLRLALGAALLIAPMLLAIHELRVRAPARQEPSSVAVVPDPLPTPGAGVAVGMLVYVDDCGSDVDVTVVAQPTAEYWLAHHNATRMTFALPNAKHGNVGFRLGESASDVITPQDVAQRGQPDALANMGRVRVVETRYEGPRRDLLVATLAVSHWKRTLAPIVATYKSADWLERRGMGSCWLRLPALTGEFTVLAAQRARGLDSPLGTSLPANGDLRVSSERVQAQAVYKAGLEAVYGSMTVTSPRAEISESLPSPTGSTNGGPTWVCMSQPKARPRSLRARRPSRTPSVISGTATGGSPGAFSAKVISSSTSGNCSVIAAVIESSAGWRRDLFMLLVGTFVGLGFTLIVDLVNRAPDAGAPEGGS